MSLYRKANYPKYDIRFIGILHQYKIPADWMKQKIKITVLSLPNSVNSEQQNNNKKTYTGSAAARSRKR